MSFAAASMWDFAVPKRVHAPLTAGGGTDPDARLAVPARSAGKEHGGHRASTVLISAVSYSCSRPEFDYSSGMAGNEATEESGWRGYHSDQISEGQAPIFHYTDASGLLGIVQNHELWATEASGMNDVSEAIQGWDFIKTWLERQDSADRIIREMERTIDASERAGFKGPSGVFMLCASTRGDDANQWRLYGTEGRGYAVELDPGIGLGVCSADEDLHEQPEGSTVPTHGRTDWTFLFEELETKVPITPWLPVLYEDADKVATLERLRAAARESYKRVSGPDDGSLEDFRGDLLQDLAIVAKLMKGQGFSGENEVRTVVTEGPSPRWSLANYRASRYGVVRYARVKVDQSKGHYKRILTKTQADAAGPLPIKSVTVGPLVRTENAIPTISALLKANGYDEVEVKESEIPLAC